MPISIILIKKYQAISEEGTRSIPETPAKIHNGCKGAPKWGSGKVSTPRFLGVLSNFRKISFLIRALLL